MLINFIVALLYKWIYIREKRGKRDDTKKDIYFITFSGSATKFTQFQSIVSVPYMITHLKVS